MFVKTIRKSSGRYPLYGVFWEPATDPASRELDCIRMGGKWTKSDGEPAGNGLYFHYRKFQEIVWTERIWEKGPFKNYWAEKILECWLESTYLGIMGCAASGKSDSLATIGLTDWYAFPDCTTTLVSSTDLKMLELRVWGLVKKYHRAAKANHSWMPGHLIEGKLMIIQDERTQFTEGRDFKNGIIGVPCFLSGTLVDTPSGSVPIENIKIGDAVTNACGVGTVTETHSNQANEIVCVTLESGKQIFCTPEHPFFTTSGWINAIDLTISNTVLSAYEALQIMRQEPERSLPKQKILFNELSDLCKRNGQVFSMRGSIPQTQKLEQEILRQILLSEMRQPMGFKTRRENEDILIPLPCVRNSNSQCSLQSEVLFDSLQNFPSLVAMPAMRNRLLVNSGISVQAKNKILQHLMPEACIWKKGSQKKSASNKAGTYGLEMLPRSTEQISHTNWRTSRQRIKTVVPIGHSIPENKIVRGDRWRNSQYSTKQIKGPDTLGNSKGNRVVRIEIFKQGSGTRFGLGNDPYKVHNLSVDSHPSYSVEGILVHNCKKGNQWVGLGSFIGIHNKHVRVIADESNLMVKGFLDSTSNLSKCPDFKLVAPGNPNETTNAHGTICEPAMELGGWEGGIDQSPGTKTWKTRFPNGLALQLPGGDSPNLKAPEDEEVPFPFLITRKQMEDDASIWGKDDWHYAMFTDAKMPRGQGSHRVVTRQECEKFGATLEPFWRDSNVTKIASLDAAYRGAGGDRCVFTEINFGKETESTAALVSADSTISQKANVPQGRNILAMVDQIIIPIDAGLKADSPESQIVRFVKEQCENRGIQPENFFFDAGMKTSLVQEFSREWSNEVQSVDFGGSPTEQRVSADIDKPCNDYYKKFVTELWFSVRLIIVSRQFRNLNKDVMWELSSREWKTSSGNKIELETKQEMKEKTSRSPDLADSLVISCWGARQRGFVISKMIPDNPVRRGPDWRDSLRKQAAEIWQSGALEYAT